MTDTSKDIVAEARSWIGTPYVHQASCKGAGCDCLGLVRGIWRALFGAEPERPPAYTADWSEPSRDEVLWRAAKRHLCEKPYAAAHVGDVILFRMADGAVAKHLGILTNVGANASFIHAYSGHGVVENALSDPWANRIVACFSFPERTN
ncbi:NlpC/P60 family protein [Aliiroseovarius marinus]|uniref:NlpC/P60 family protein n=1 Tax=Aliiroseovarius marinus TaxID=2500159 RepID=UPI003D7E7383